jgi:hypothetical protein
MAYAAYLRVYEPVSAFREPDGSRWTADADSPVRPYLRARNRWRAFAALEQAN